jgi:Phosphodiester glycosidase
MIGRTKPPFTQQQQGSAAHKPAWLRRHRRTSFALGMVSLLALMALGLAMWAHADPALVPQAVDLARGIVGPGPVAQVEAWVFQLEDSARQAHYQTTGATAPVGWAAPAATLPPTHVQPALPSSHPHIGANGARAQPAPAALPASGPTGASEQSIWSPYITTADGQAVLERASVAPDPERPYVQAALVRIDLRQAQLHLVAGTLEPASSVHVARSGRIPSADQAHLIAAFNGGFKAVNGAFGMAVNGTTLLPPQDGLATLAMYRDGSVRLGVWGADIKQTPDLVAFRQNCPLLVDNRQITALAESDDATLWGATVKNKIATWRSGLGLSTDGRYLIYVVGDGLTVPTLAQALVDAGADRGMQLDINSYWTRFVTYATPSAKSTPVATKLLDGMLGDAHQFLAPDTRDFFYLTER